jgi:hypothetical protein
MGPNIFSYAANSPTNFTDPTGLTKKIPTDCEELRKYIEELYRNFQGKLDQYDPVEDGSGEIPKDGGGFHLPGVHYDNLISLQNKLIRALQQYEENCGGNNPAPVCVDKVKSPIPKPVYRTPPIVQAAEAAAAAYVVYRVVRFIPSLFPPLWWTIPANAVIP